MSDDLALQEVEVHKPEAEDLRLYSVTTIIRNSTSSEGLNYWGKEQVAKAAVEDLEVLRAMAKKDPAVAIEWLMGAPYRRPKGQRSAAELGSAFHRWAENYALEGVPATTDAELRPLCEAFDAWCQVMQPAYEAAELTVFDREYGFAGTADAILVIDGVRFLVDYKTSREGRDRRGNLRKPYRETALQLAAYRHAQCAATWREIRRHEVARRRYYLLSPAEQGLVAKVPKVDGTLAIHVSPEGCHAYPVRTDEEIFDWFLYHLEAARFALDTSMGLIGDPLQKQVAA